MGWSLLEIVGDFVRDRVSLGISASGIPPGLVGSNRKCLGGAIKLVCIGETASSSSTAVEGNLDNVGDEPAWSVVTHGAEHIEGGGSPRSAAHSRLQNRCRAQATRHSPRHLFAVLRHQRLSLVVVVPVLI